MKNNTNIMVLVALAVVVAAIVLARQLGGGASGEAPTADAAVADVGPATTGGVAVAVAAPQPEALPRLVDLGAGKCIPCKMMKPILDDLKLNYADVFTTEFIDVWEDDEAGKAYGIRLIPTQIFFAADGSELYRHEGFYAKDDILAKWKELGIERGPGQ